MTSQGVTRVVGNRKGVFTRGRQPKLAAHTVRSRYLQLANTSKRWPLTLGALLQAPSAAAEVRISNARMPPRGSSTRALPPLHTCPGLPPRALPSLHTWPGIHYSTRLALPRDAPKAWRGARRSGARGRFYTSAPCHAGPQHTSQAGFRRRASRGPAPRLYTPATAAPQTHTWRPKRAAEARGRSPIYGLSLND